MLNPSDFKDLRAIYILPFLSKVLKKVMPKQINDNLDKCSLLPDIQFGFRKGYTCTTALLKITDDILTATDKSLLTVLILLDFSRTFDT